MPILAETHSARMPGLIFIALPDRNADIEADTRQ
jgi:hypothetical protein